MKTAKIKIATCQGMTFVEIIVSIAILGMVVVGFAPIFMAGVTWTFDAGKHDRLVSSSAGIIENVLSDSGTVENALGYDEGSVKINDGPTGSNQETLYKQAQIATTPEGQKATAYVNFLNPGYVDNVTILGQQVEVTSHNEKEEVKIEVFKPDAIQ